MINTLYLPELREMLAEGDRAGLCEFCEALHAARTAEFMEGLTAAEIWEVLQTTDAQTRVEIFRYLAEDLQEEILELGDPHSLSKLIADMPPDDRVDLLKRVDPRFVESMLPLMPAVERRDILRLTAYPEGTAGSVMTTEVARLSESLTVREALQELAQQTSDLETIYYVYLVDDENHLRGTVSARQLVTHLGKPETLLADLMERDLVTVLTTDDQEAVAEKVANYNFIAIPVVDHELHLVGIITHDDIIDVLQEEATEDAYRAGGVEPLERSYMSTPWFQLARHRAGWLAILFVAALGTTFSLKHYNQTIQQVAWLVWFLPLVISSGGNTGGQSATLIIRALTTKEITTADWWQILKRELYSGLLLGIFLGILGFAIGCLFLRLQPTHAMVIPMALVLVIVCSTQLGAMLPLLFQKAGLDPALMSNPFVSGISDITGIFIYISVAKLLIKDLW